jgi:hypothetical protein
VTRVPVEWPKHAVTLRYVATSLAHLGRPDEARQAFGELLQVQPNSTLSRSRHAQFRHPWMDDLDISGPEAAGLPE